MNIEISNKSEKIGTCEIVDCFSMGSTFVQVNIGNTRTISIWACEEHALSWMEMNNGKH